MKKKRRSKRSVRLWAAGCLTVVLCAGIIFYGSRMARAPQERESQDTAQEENAAQAGNTTNVEAQVKDNPDAKDETGNGTETGAGDTASVDGQTSADGTSGDGSGADAANAGSTGSAEADMQPLRERQTASSAVLQVPAQTAGQNIPAIFLHWTIRFRDGDRAYSSTV